MPDVSVIIPCFNHGQYIHEAINSVLKQTCQNFEIIVVNDGSTDPQTISILKKIEHPKIKVVHTVNQGLASARNNGIREAQSEFILPLDSDDTIAPQYVEKALPLLKNDLGLGIVYCQAELFGDKKGIWKLPEYSLKEMLFRNHIFHCAFFRFKDWEKVNGYNPNMKYGWEDWNFWLSLISLGKKVYQIPEILHAYRVRKGSMLGSMSIRQKAEMHVQIFLNHQDLFKDHLLEFFEEIHRMQNLCNRSILERFINDKLRHPIQTFKNQENRSNIIP